jgi:amino acid adenylation domain-containing protein
MRMVPPDAVGESFDLTDSAQALHMTQPAERLVFPMSFAQQRLWFLDQLEPGKSVYNVHEAIRLSGKLDVSALEQSINEIVRRHESLRTTFAELDDNPMQIVAPSLHVPLSISDLRELAHEEREKTAFRLASDAAGQPFNLARGPLIRALLIRLQENDQVLLVITHHIISEGGWSMGVFLRELGALYNAYSAGQPSPLAELPIQYGDYAVWQQDWLKGDVLEQQLAYWKEHLRGAPAVMELPTDRPRPPAQSYRGARESLLMPVALKQELAQFGSEEGVTLFMTLLAAFQLLLFRYVRQESLVTGIATAGRSSPEVQDLIGFFVNTLVLRTDVSGDITFRQLLNRTRQVTLDAYAHQDLPFELLVQASRPDRSLAYTPLFQVMFSFQNTPREPLDMTGIMVSPFDVEIRTSMFDLTLYAWEKPDGLLVTLEYSTDLFDATTIQRMLRQFQVLLQSAVSNPDATVSALPLLSEPENHQLRVTWNDTTRDYPRDSPFHTLFENQARLTPQALAVSFGQETYTYAQLNEKANQLAHHLKSLEVGLGALVGICVERSLEIVVGLLGILKAGAAYVPVDPADPPERIAWVLKDAQAPVLLTQQHLIETLAEYSGTVVCLDRDWPAISGRNVTDPASNVTAKNRAYVIYTSGSTGRPKGVQLTHRNLVNLLDCMREKTGMTNKDVLAAVTTLSFDIAGLEIWMPLLVGARVVVVSRETSMNGAELAIELARRQATFLQATPSTWQILLDSGWRGSPQLNAICGGEALPTELADRLRPKVRTLWNVYGPTETTIWSSAHFVDRKDHTVPIGRPLANTQFYVLDPDRQLVPIGVPGELYIGGDGVAMGYLNRPDLTTEKFVSNPFDPSGQSRLYRTGDRVRYRADGNLEYLGRLDYQIKLRGFRIELGEISEGLSAHPAVREAVAILREDGGGEKRIVAYFVARDHSSPPPDELRNFLKKKLPSHMIPAQFVRLDALPRLPNGKIDRSTLPVPERSEFSPDKFLASRDKIEDDLIQIWEELLQTKPIGVRDNFFDLGGHSLLLAKLLRKIEHVFGKKLSMAAVFQQSTVEKLADLIRDRTSVPRPSRVLPIQPQGTRPPFICLGAGPFFLPLASRVGSDQPFLGLDLSELDPAHLPTPIKLEDIAAFVVKAVREFQPEGPYYIGGWCLFGILAYEAACQMIASGQDVALLTLIDSPNPAYFESLSALSRIQALLQRIQYHLVNLGRSKTAEMPRYLLDRLNILRYKATRLQERVQYNAANSTGQQSVDLDQALYLAATTYQPRPYPGRVAIFQAVERPRGQHWDLGLRWREPVKGELEVYDVAGGHRGMFDEPYVQSFATMMASCLATAGASKEGHPALRV